MAGGGRSRRGMTVSVAIIACIVTVTSVTWLSSLIATQHTALATWRLSPRGRQQLHQKAQEYSNSELNEVRNVTEIRIAVTEDTDLTPGGRGRPKTFSTGKNNHAKSIISSLQETTRKNQAAGQKICRALPNTDYWGDALVWGNKNTQPSAEACCNACSNYKPTQTDEPSCNVWVYCGDKQACKGQYQECWLKYLRHPEGSSPKTGPNVPWTSGVFGLPPPVDYKALTKQSGGADRSFHVVVTAQGAATHWQVRVHYYWYKKIQRQCREIAAVCHMGGWTRLLHSGEPDDLMSEIPTHVVKPLQDKDNQGYVVLNRPWAFVQWLREVTVPEKYILMSEPDHVWLKPMPNLMSGETPASFPFFYIEPAKADNVRLTEKFTGKLTRSQLDSISPIGNAPTLLAYSDLKHMATTWMNVSHAIFDDAEAHKAWGWVLEMYGFTIACFKAGLPPAELHLKMMAQPPWDNDVPWGPSFFLLHYTYGMDYTKDGVFTPGKIGEWRFDKRTYSNKPPPRNLQMPPANMDNTLTRHLINAINEATAAIPGWDSYSQTGMATQFWDGEFLPAV